MVTNNLTAYASNNYGATEPSASSTNILNFGSRYRHPASFAIHSYSSTPINYNIRYTPAAPQLPGSYALDLLEYENYQAGRYTEPSYQMDLSSTHNNYTSRTQEESQQNLTDYSNFNNPSSTMASKYSNQYWGTQIPALINFGASGYNSFLYENKPSDLEAEVNSRYSRAGDNYYMLKDNVDRNAVLSETNKLSNNNVFKTAAYAATAGSMLGLGGAIAGGLGGAAIAGIGSIIRRKKAEDYIDIADLNINRENRYNRAYALTKGAQQDAINRRGLPGQGVLYTDAGKDRNTDVNMNKIKLTLTPEGFRYAPHTAYGEGGEVVGNATTGNWNIIKGDNRDNKPLSVGSDDVVISKHYDLARRAIPAVIAINKINRSMGEISAAVSKLKSQTSKEIADRVTKGTMNNLQQKKYQYNKYLSSLADEQAYLRSQGYLPQNQPIHADDGIDNGFNWPNFIVGVTGGLTGLGLYFLAHNQRIKKPETYFPNQYAPRAFNILNNLKTNTKASIDAINDESASTNYMLNNSGGLNAGQRAAARIANTLSAQSLKSKIYAAADNQDNTYKSTLAQHMLTTGAQEATNRISTLQSDNDYYSKAHAAKLKGELTGIYNWLNSLQSYVSNANKWAMYKNMYGLYDDYYRNHPYWT